MKPKIVVAGSSNTDMVVKSPHLPKPGETVIGRDLTIAAGGKGANQAVSAARSGADVLFITKVGNDHFGRQAIDGFKKEKIRTEFVYIDKSAPSGVALIMVDEEGQNIISVAPGANARLTPANVRKAKSVIKSAQVLLVQLEIPIETAVEAIKIAADCNIKTILNPAPAKPLPDDLFSKITIITPNETEAEILTGIKIIDEQSASVAARSLYEKGVQTVVITLGGKGAFIYDDKNSNIIPPPRVKPVDTTAAGDVFNGAIAVAVAEGKSIIEAIKFANAAAALSVTKLGAQPSAPKRNQILKLMKSTYSAG